MQAVVLAAGVGRRLSESTTSVAKPLVPVAGMPLIAHTLSALAETAVDRAIVVTGHERDAVEATVRDWAKLPIEFAFNPQYAQGASYSLGAARALSGEEPFLLVMSDHAMSSDLISVILRSAADAPLGDTCRVAADRSGHHDDAYVAEATKLATDATGSVTAIGKALPAWDALDAGAFLCSPAVWDALDAAAEDCDLSQVFGWLGQRGRLGTVDISGHFWYDIDTIEDLLAAERLLTQGASRPLPSAR